MHPSSAFALRWLVVFLAVTIRAENNTPFDFVAKGVFSVAKRNHATDRHLLRRFIGVMEIETRRSTHFTTRTPSFPFHLIEPRTKPKSTA